LLRHNALRNFKCKTSSVPTLKIPQSNEDLVTLIVTLIHSVQRVLLETPSNRPNLPQDRRTTLYRGERSFRTPNLLETSGERTDGNLLPDSSQRYSVWDPCD